MEVMLAYDHSRNSRIALEAVKQLFAKELPTVTLISVIEEPGSNTSAGDEMFEAQYQAQKQGAERAAAELVAAGFSAKVLVAEGDARKMILRATRSASPTCWSWPAIRTSPTATSSPAGLMPWSRSSTT